MWKKIVKETKGKKIKQKENNKTKQKKTIPVTNEKGKWD